MGIQITPLASLCLGVVRGWINVAKKGKGGQIDQEGTAWSRLPADQLRDQLEREFLVETSTRSIHRALKELSDANLLRREQRWKQRYRRDYWYAIPEHEEELLQYSPRTVQDRYRSQQKGSKEHHESTPASGHVLKTPNINKINSLLKEKTNSQKPKRKETNPPMAKSIGDAVEKCNSKGIRRRPKPNGFGAENKPLRPLPLPSKPIPIGMDKHGRPVSEVWVGDCKHLVID